MPTRRSFLVSAVLHVLAAMVIVLLGVVGPHPREMPPVYQVNLVSASEVAPRPTEPRKEESEPLEVPEPEPEEEAIPDPEEEPTPETAEPREEEPEREGPERDTETGPDLPLTLEGKPFPFPWYLEELVRKVERGWRPTSNTLSATVHFRITDDGRVVDTEVSESSGNFLFDRAALRAVQGAVPMPPLPDGYTGDFLGVYFVFDTDVRPR